MYTKVTTTPVKVQSISINPEKSPGASGVQEIAPTQAIPDISSPYPVVTLKRAMMGNQQILQTRDSPMPRCPREPVFQQTAVHAPSQSILQAQRGKST